MSIPNTWEGPCSGCGARRYDRGRFFWVYRLCRWCFDDPEVRSLAAYRYRTVISPPVEKPLPPVASEYPPGHPNREETIRWRLANGYSLYHPADATWDEWCEVGIEVEAEREFRANFRPSTKRERVYQRKGSTGVEWSKGRARARPFWNGIKHNLGAFDRESEARAAVEKFWRDQLGLFAPYRDQAKFWGYRPPVAVVRATGVRVPIFRHHLRRIAAPDPVAFLRSIDFARCRTERAVLSRLEREAKRIARRLRTRPPRAVAWAHFASLYPDPDALAAAVLPAAV